MSNIMPFLIMDALAAARFREQTAGQMHRLDPREVEAGRHKGKFVLPERVKVDPAHVALRPAFAVMEVVALDIDEAWPQPAEET